MLNSTARKPARPRVGIHFLLMLFMAVLALAGCAQREASDQTDDAEGPGGVAARYAGIPQAGNILGNPYAPVTLVDFSDLRCSHCRDFAQITLPVVLDRYVRTGQVRVVFQNLPILGQASVQAARMAVAVGLQGHLFEFVDAFYAHEPAVVSDDSLRQIASSVPGVDPDRALADSQSSMVASVLADIRTMAGHYQVSGTPTILLGASQGDLHVVQSARATQPDTVTGPIDDLLAGRGQR